MMTESRTSEAGMMTSEAGMVTSEARWLTSEAVSTARAEGL